VSLTSAPPAIQQQVMASEALRERSVNPLTGLVDYVVPNVTSTVFAKPQARLALAAATDRTAYVTALGGTTAAAPALSLIPAALPAAHGEDPVGAGVGGDPERARALLAEAGLEAPVAIRVAYRSSQTADKAMAALAAGWTEGGFAPELEPIEDDYFTRIARPEAKDRYDVLWSNWAPAWASASTVLPPLFDSSVNLTAAGPGRDYGYFADPAVNEAMTKAGAVADPVRREQAWAEVDRGLLRQGAYVALAEQRALHLAGSSVRNLSANELLGGVVEFADIAVEP
jgi:peptide/nickel transport system substrate-binding protein